MCESGAPGRVPIYILVRKILARYDSKETNELPAASSIELWVEAHLRL